MTTSSGTALLLKAAEEGQDMFKCVIPLESKTTQYGDIPHKQAKRHKYLMNVLLGKKPLTGKWQSLEKSKQTGGNYNEHLYNGDGNSCFQS